MGKEKNHVGIIGNILDSFTTAEGGFSARKLTAFWFAILASYVHYAHLDNDNAVEFLIVDVCAMFLCLSIITAQDIINLKTGNTTISKQEVTIKDTQVQP